MEHEHEPIRALTTFLTEGDGRVRNETCSCGATRVTRAQIGEWIIAHEEFSPEDQAFADGAPTPAELQDEMNQRDVCIAGESARNGVCGDPECVCAPSPPETTVKTSCNRSQNVSKLQYVAKHGHVLHGTSNVATARSRTFAKRIAKALNQLQEQEREP